jgi:hypothetical protein
MNNLVAKHMKTFQKGAGEHKNRAYEAKNSCLVSDEDLMYYQITQEDKQEEVVNSDLNCLYILCQKTFTSFKMNIVG